MRYVRVFCYLIMGLLCSLGVQAVCDPLQYEVQDSILLCDEDHYLEQPILVTGTSFTFDCNGATLYGEPHLPAFIINNTNEVTLKNCNIDTAHVGVFIDNSINPLITENSITSTERGIYLTESVSGARVRTNAIFLSAREAIGVHGINGYYEANELFDNFYGFYIYNESSGHHLKYNRVDGNTFGAVIEGDSTIVESNGFDENGEAVRLLMTTDTTLENNRMFQNRANGVFVYMSKLNSITNNNISYNEKSGIVFLGSQQNVFSDNHVIGNDAAGVFITSQSTDNQVIFNTFHHNNLYAININSSDLNSVTDNVIMQAPFVIEDNSVGTIVCPKNKYENGALGPLCGTEKEETVAAVPEPTVVPTNSPVVIETKDSPFENEPDSAKIEALAEVIEEVEANEEKDSGITDLLREETKVLSLPTQISSEDLENIVTEILKKDNLKAHESVLAKKEMLDQIRATEEKVVVSKNIKTSRIGDELFTLVNTTVRVAADMEEVNVYESIPKECAENIEHLQFGVMNYPGVTFEVIDADPLIVWKFPSVKKGDVLTVSYTVQNAVSEVPRTLTVESPDNVINIRQELVCNHRDAPKTVVLAQKIRVFSWMMFFLVGIIVLVPVALVAMSKKTAD